MRLYIQLLDKRSETDGPNPIEFLPRQEEHFITAVLRPMNNEGEMWWEIETPFAHVLFELFARLIIADNIKLLRWEVVG